MTSQQGLAGVKNAAGVTAEASHLSGVLMPIAQVTVTVFITGIGLMLGCTIGSLAYPSPPLVGAIVGGIFASVIFLCIGCGMTGVWRLLMPQVSMEETIFAHLPHAVAKSAGGYSTFTVLVTVHNLINVKVTNRLITSPQLYVEVDCEGNPPKATCVKSDGTFNEQFQLHITPSVKGMVFRIIDQQLFGSLEVACAPVQVMELVEKNFPTMLTIPLQPGQSQSLWFGDPPPAIVVSFDPTDDYDMSLVAKRQGEAPNMWESYGSVDYLSKVQFNTKMKLGAKEGGQGGPPGPTNYVK